MTERLDLSDQLEISRLVYGMWRVAEDADTSPAHVQAKIEACLEQGITTMDQADIYGDYGAEAVLGGALRAAPAAPVAPERQDAAARRCAALRANGRRPAALTRPALPRTCLPSASRQRPSRSS